jgi:sugar O-acyltransferase (sialic acid O-acetyltransferase NeuD family)
MKKALVGYGGHAREVLAQIGEDLPCFVDDEFVCSNTLPLSTFDPSKYKVLVAIGNSSLRKQVVNKLPLSTQYFTFIHPTALLLDSNIVIGQGSFIGAYSVLTTNIKLGNHSLLNRSNHIGHDCQIGDFLSLMPNSIISGNVTVGDEVYIGTNSSIREKIIIGNKITIGLNSGVITNISHSGVYGGVPVKKLK